MAFNLNKNEAGNPSTKFDLSKSGSPAGADATPGKSKSKTWLFALAGLLVAGIAAWYFMTGSGAQNESGNTAATATDSNAASIAPGDQNTIAASFEDSSTMAAGNRDNPVAKPGNNTAAAINNSVPATFAKGSNSISALNGAVVKGILAFLEKNPGSVITVHGYASSEGDVAVNQAISQARADAFKKYLLSKGISSSRVHAIGKGVDNPIASNDTEAGRTKNRRVEISLQ